MRLSEWRATPARDGAGVKVAAVVGPVLAALGAGDDPHAWVAWGEEPGTRYAILVPTDPGLIVCYVRVAVLGEGPRATAKLVRWNRVAIGELAVDAQQGHRLVSFQVEQQVLRGVDSEADRVAAFALRVIAAIDGRPLPPVEETGRRGRAGSPPGRTSARSAAKGPAKTSSTTTRGARPAAADRTAPPDRSAPADRAAARSRR